MAPWHWRPELGEMMDVCPAKEVALLCKGRRINHGFGLTWATTRMAGATAMFTHQRNALPSPSICYSLLKDTRGKKLLFEAEGLDFGARLRTCFCKLGEGPR